MSEQQAGESAGTSRRPGRVAGATFVWPAPRTSMRQPVLRGGREHRQVWGFAREWTTTDPAHVSALEWLSDVSKAVKDARLARAWSRDDLAASAGLSYNAVKDLESRLRRPSAQTLFMVLHTLQLVVTVEHARHLTPRTAAGPSTSGGSA